MHDPRGFCLVKEKTNYYTIFLPFPEIMEEEVLLMLKGKKKLNFKALPGSLCWPFLNGHLNVF